MTSGEFRDRLPIRWTMQNKTRWAHGKSHSGGVVMKTKSTEPTPKAEFPTIQPDMVNRLSREAELRTLQPEAVDWAEIHRKAAEARNK